MRRDQTWRKREVTEELACWHLGNRKKPAGFSPMKIKAVPGEANSSSSQGWPSGLETAAFVAIVSAAGETCTACDNSSRVSYCRAGTPTGVFPVPPADPAPHALERPSSVPLSVTCAAPSWDPAGGLHSRPVHAISGSQPGSTSVTVPEQPCQNSWEEVGPPCESKSGDWKLWEVWFSYVPEGMLLNPARVGWNGETGREYQGAGVVTIPL